MKRAKVTVSEVQVECPYCEEILPNPEGASGHNSTVATLAPTATCDQCGKAFEVPSLVMALGTTLRFRARSARREHA